MATTQTPPAAERTGRFHRDRSADVVIVGAGFSGLAVAYRLKEAGFEDFVILERGDDVGGTWHYNTYPGCQCDVPSHLYSFSFAPNPEWSRTYSEQAEIKRYIRDTAERAGLVPHIRLGCEVTGAAWDDEACRWRVETTDGEYTGRVLVSGHGGLSEPALPDVPGLDGFEGTWFHSAQWNHHHDVRGERIAVVGTGASAIQIVPRLQPIVESLHLFQRTPAWVTPHRDRPITEAERTLYRRVPAAQKAVRSAVYWTRELLVPGLAFHPPLQKPIQKLALQHLKAQVRDPELREKLTPDFTIGCKRILPSNHFYPALTEPNAEVIASGVAEVRPRSIVAQDGTEREVDTIVFGTGFRVTDIPMAGMIRGRDGRSLDEHWQGSPRAYRGTTVPGFPNLFLMVGPNTGLGHTSIVHMAESQTAYVVDALRLMRERGVESVEPKPAAQQAWIDDVDAKLERSVWNTGGCASWYLDRTGRNSTLWPDFTWKYRLLMRRFDASSYVARAASSDGGTTAAPTAPAAAPRVPA